MLREDRLAQDLDWLAAQVGADPAGVAAPPPDPVPDFLHDPALIAAAKAAYMRDYVGFGFTDEPGAA